MKQCNLEQKSTTPFLVILLFLMCNAGLSQTYIPPTFTTYPVCGTSDSVVNSFSKTQAVSCTNNSAAYISKYGKQDFYIPTKATEPDITIKITFHVINNTSGEVSPWPGVAGATALTQAGEFLDYYYSDGTYQPRSANYAAPLSCNYPI